MSVASSLRRTGSDFVSAVQFLTRIPMPNIAYRDDSLASAVKFFPIVGALIGGLAALVSRLTVGHLPRAISALMVMIFLISVTGALHEDGLADAADAFGGGHTKEKILLILKDSRIGSYGAVALCLSVLGRVLLLSSLPLKDITPYLIVAGALSRWTVLPLSFFLPSARNGEGQGARIARLTSGPALIFGSICAFLIAGLMLRWSALPIAVATVLIAWASGAFYARKIGGTTGDCFGATLQVTEMAIYLCGVWG